MRGKMGGWEGGRAIRWTGGTVSLTLEVVHSPKLGVTKPLDPVIVRRPRDPDRGAVDVVMLEEIADVALLRLVAEDMNRAQNRVARVNQWPTSVALRRSHRAACEGWHENAVGKKIRTRGSRGRRCTAATSAAVSGRCPPGLKMLQKRQIGQGAANQHGRPPRRAHSAARTGCHMRRRASRGCKSDGNKLGISQGPVSGRDGILQHPVHLALNIYFLLRYISNRFVTGSTSNRL